MAKQDLVVKLLLDSGAFGNDLRQAERKAKEFKDNMSRAGNTVGGIGKTIGGSLGGVTKLLGGIAAGAGVAVAAFEGFKSVMNSTNETAKIFHGTIAGFESVLDTFQRSLAKMDFSGFINGIDEVYARGKRWKELQLDVNLATVAYNFLNARDVDIFKSYEKSFRDAKTDDDKAKIKADVAKHLEGMRLNVTDYKDIVNREFLAGLENIEKMFDEENLIKLFGNDTKLEAERVVELIYDAMQRRLSNPRLGLMDTDMADYEAVMEEYKKWNKKAKKGIGWRGQTRFDVLNAIAQRDKIYTDNQELFFRKALYEYTDEQLNAALAKIINSINQDKAITELELNAKGWGGEAPTKTPKITPVTSPVVNHTQEEIKAMEGSIAKINEKIAEAKKLRDKYVLGSVAWLEEAANVASLERQLKSMEAQMEKLLAKYNATPIPTIPDTITQMMMTPKDTGLAVPKGWKKEGGIYMKDEEPPMLKDIDSIIANVTNLNTVLSSSVMLINGMGDAFANCEDESIRNLAGVTDVLGTVGNAAINLAQIYQSAIATNEAYAASVALGQAAALPFPANIAAITTVMGTLISIISQITKISNAGKFAEGGIVGGTSFSGDKLFAMVNSGEMILNKRQQRNLGNMLGGGGQVEFHISGDALVGVLNNKNRKTNLTR